MLPQRPRMSMAQILFGLRFLAIGVVFGGLTARAADEAAIGRADQYRLERPHFTWPAALNPSPAQEAQLKLLAQRPAPAFDFRSYVPRLLKEKSSPLSAEQRKAFEQVRDHDQALLRRLHDEYNVARMEYVLCGWRYVAASDAEVPKLQRELEEWLQLYLHCSADHEALADQLGRAYWKLLTPEQQHAVQNREWERYARIEPGHSRAYSVKKVLQRAVGKLDPATAERLDRESANWEARHNAILERLKVSETQLSRLEYYYDFSDPALFTYSLPRLMAAHAEMLALDTEALRALFGQLDPAKRTEWEQKVKAAADQDRATMLEKYTAEAGGLLRVLGELK